MTLQFYLALFSREIKVTVAKEKPSYSPKHEFALVKIQPSEKILPLGA
jgi:hypothetical protein